MSNNKICVKWNRTRITEQRLKNYEIWSNEKLNYTLIYKFDTMLTLGHCYHKNKNEEEQKKNDSNSQAI